MKTLDIIDIDYPSNGVAYYNDKKLKIKNSLPGQQIKVLIKRRKVIPLEVVKKSDKEITPICSVFEKCGGCTYQNINYDYELELKSYMVQKILKNAQIEDFEYLGIQGTPQTAYRNKMEYSFGDEYKDGPLSLGLRTPGAMYQTVNNSGCNIVDKDFTNLLMYTQDFFKSTSETFYNRKHHTGTLRYFVVRKGINTGEILVSLVTTSQVITDLTPWLAGILSLNLLGKISGVIHIKSDNLGDAINPEDVRMIYGKDFYTERILNLDFKVYFMAFFQTNTVGAEILYSYVLDFLNQCKNRDVVYDLYCGTGTIGQIASSICGEVHGIDLNLESIQSAKENVVLNNIKNCYFFAGDVKDAIDEIGKKPDVIILDPPREGLHPKALKKVVELNPPEIIYVSCKPTSFANDVKSFEESGYKLVKLKLLDMFPRTSHVESIGLLRKC